MGQTPPKYFLPSAPYGTSPSSVTLNPSQPAAVNPQVPLLPPNFTDPGTMTQKASPTTPAITNRPQGNPFKGLYGLLALLLMLAPSAFGTTTVTGNMKNLGTGSVNAGAFMRFWLRGCGGNQPRINGTGLIAPTQGGVFYFDLVANSSGAVSGTIYSTRDSTGLLGGDIECGGSTTSVWYGMQAFVNGKAGPEIPVHALNSATLDISNVTPITTNPVVASPTGDSTYLRKDGGNSPLTGPVSSTSTISDAGGTHSGTETFAIINNVVYADQQAGADFCAKLLTAHNALPAGGGTINALGFQGSQSCATGITLSKSGVQYLFPVNLTVTPSAGVQIVISGSNVQFNGAGDSTLFDFSTGTSATGNFNITGSRVTFQNIKINGNRIATGTADCLAVTGGDRVSVLNNTFTNCGSVAIDSVNTTNLVEKGNVFSSVQKACMFHGATTAKALIAENRSTDCNLSQTGGHGAIMFAGVLTTDITDIIVRDNLINEVTAGASHVGIGLNNVTGAIVIGNKVSGNSGSGECIAVTASKVRIIGNETTNSNVSGILYFAATGFSTDFVIANNVSYSNGTNGISIVWGSNSLTISDGAVHGNRLKGNSSYGLQTYNGGSFTSPAIKNLAIYGNAWLGNTTGDFNLLAVTGSPTIFGNTEVDNDATFRVTGTGLGLTCANAVSGTMCFAEQISPGGAAGQENVWGDSTAHRLKMNNNNGGAKTVAALESDTFTSPTINLLTNGTGVQIFNVTLGSSSPGCATLASVGATCTTANLTLPVAEADTSYRVVCTGKGPTGVPVVVNSANASATQFTLTIAALTASAASFASADCTVGHN